MRRNGKRTLGSDETRQVSITRFVSTSINTQEFYSLSVGNEERRVLPILAAFTNVSLTLPSQN